MVVRSGVLVIKLLLIFVLHGAEVLNDYQEIFSVLLVSSYVTIPIMDELCKQSCNFINACLSSNCHLVRFIARHGIFCRQMSSSFRCNAHFCFKRYGGQTQDISLLLSIVLLIVLLLTGVPKKMKIHKNDNI